MPLRRASAQSATAGSRPKHRKHAASGLESFSTGWYHFIPWKPGMKTMRSGKTW